MKGSSYVQDASVGVRSGMAVRASETIAPLHVSVRGEPAQLRVLRGALRLWLLRAEVPPEVAWDVLMACSEACTNAVAHAYRHQPRPGAVELDARRSRSGTLVCHVRDSGRWRQALDERPGGGGLSLMCSLMDKVEVRRSPGGTVVRMSRRLA